MQYVIARNRGKRPTLPHAVRGRRTLCGTQMVGWTRVYLKDLGPLEPLLCKRCQRLSEETTGRANLRLA